MILALDIATKTGWAVGAAGSVPTAGTISLSGNGGDKFLGLATQLNLLVSQHEPDLIIFEQPIHAVPIGGSSSTLRVLVGLASVAEMVAAKHGIRCVEVPMATWRKHFIGVSRAPAYIQKKNRRDWIKAESINRCKQLKWGSLSDDEAEACGIWDYACSLRSKAHQLATAPGLLQGSADA